MRKKFFEKPTLSVKAINVHESIVASITILDNGWVGGSYATTFYKRDSSGNVLSETGTHEQGCFDKLTNIIDMNLVANNITDNWAFNSWIVNHVFDGKTDKNLFTADQTVIYKACCHF